MGLWAKIKGTVLTNFNIGNGSASDITITAKNAATNKPQLKYSNSGSKWQYSNDGSLFSDMGSGGSTLYNQSYTWFMGV